MKLYGTMGIGFAALLLATGCAHRVRVNSVNLERSGTYVVSSPGALTIARQSASAVRACTLRVGGRGMAGHGKHAKHAKHGEHGGHGWHGDHHMGGRHASGGGGPAGIVDVVLFRLCEARANNDITPQEYSADVQMLLKTMSEMAKRRPPAPPQAFHGPWGPKGMRGMRENRGDHRWGGRDHDGGPEHHEGPGGPNAHGEPHPGPHPARKGNDKRKHR